MSEWLSIRDAAQAMGVSDLTVRRRIKDGRIEHRLRDGKYYVRVSTTAGTNLSPVEKVSLDERDSTEMGDPDDRSDQAGSDAEARVVPSFDVDALLSQHASLAQAAGRAAQLEEQLRTMESRYQALHEGALVLATRNGWLESKLEERENDLRLLTDSQHRGSWLRRLIRGTNNGTAS
jgi:excisionase family DNA binding protein